MTPLEELANKLYESAFDPEVSPLEDSGYKDEIMMMAKAAQLLCLEARLDECKGSSVGQTHKEKWDRARELRDQLTELRKESRG